MGETCLFAAGNAIGKDICKRPKSLRDERKELSVVPSLEGLGVESAPVMLKDI